MSAVERWKSMSAGVLQQSVGDDRVADGVVDILVLHVGWSHVLVATAATSVRLVGHLVGIVSHSLTNRQFVVHKQQIRAAAG